MSSRNLSNASTLIDRRFAVALAIFPSAKDLAINTRLHAANQGPKTTTYGNTVGPRSVIRSTMVESGTTIFTFQNNAVFGNASNESASLQAPTCACRLCNG